MIKAIFKYPLQVTDEQTLELPVGAEILTVQTQNDDPYVWAMVDPSGIEKEERIIEVLGTGQSIYCGDTISRKYIGTFQLLNGSFVGHVFEMLNTNP